MATLETQYNRYLNANPKCGLSFNEWKKMHGEEIKQAMSKINNNK
jgi:hypothetical protein